MIDAHVHLQDIRNRETLGGILHQAPGRGVRFFFCNATSPEDWDRVAGISRQQSGIAPFFGIHPWYGDRAAAGWESRLEDYLKEPGTGVGEAGLDKGKKGGDFERQKEILSRQLEIAERLGRPLVLHCVKAWPELMDLLRARRPARRRREPQVLASGDGIVGIPARSRLLLHSFSGPEELLPELAAAGAFFSFSWRQFQRQAGKTAALVRRVPADRILIETDYPYIGADDGGTGQDEEQYFTCLTEAYAAAARAKGLDPAVLKETVFRNGTFFLHGTSDR